MKKRMVKRVVSFALAMVMVLTSVLVGGVEEAKAATPEEITLQDKEFTGNIWNDGIWTITPSTWTNASFEVATYDEWAKPESDMNTSALKFWMGDGGSFTVTQTIASVPAGNYTLSIPVMGEKAAMTVGFGDETSDAVDLTGYGVWHTVSKTFTVEEDATDVLVTIAGACEVGGYGYIDRVDLVGTTEDPAPADPVYAVEVTANKTSVTQGEAVELTAAVTKDGVEMTAQEMKDTELQLWFWADKWQSGHEDGLVEPSDIVFSENDSNSGYSLTATATLKTDGNYYVVAELKTVDGKWVAQDDVTLVATKGTTSESTPTPDPKPETTPEPETKPEEEKVVKIELKNSNFTQQIVDNDPVWKGTTKSGIWEKGESKNRFYQLAYSSDAWLELASYCSGAYCMKMEAIAGDTLEVVQYVDKLEAGTYTMTVPVMGGDGKVALVLNGVESEVTTLKGWNEWSYVKVTFKLAEDVANAEVGIKLYSDASVGGWAFVDSITLLKGVPKTGDTTNVYAYVVLMMAGLAIVGYSVKRNKVQF